MQELSTAMTIYICFISALLGLCMGSFLNCFAYRYAKNESVMKGRSHCALCGHMLRGADLIPVFSWVFLRGKCRYCGEKISAKYLLSELLLGTVYVTVFLRFGLTLEALKFLIFASLVFTAAMSDIYSQLIPDRLIIIGIISAILFAFFTENIWSSLLWTLVGGFSVALPLMIIVLLFDKLMKRESMGGGDIKLIFMMGLYFDWKLNILLIIIACIVGIIFALVQRRGADTETENTDPDTEEDETPSGAFSFAPALAIAAWIVMLVGERFMNWYLGLFMI